MNNVPEIKFVLRFSSQTHIPADLTARILLEVEKSILELEIRDLVTIKKEFPELTDEKIEELKDKLGRGELKGLYLEKATSGSIILVGTLAGVATACLWLLNQTLGEDVKTAWVDTDMSKRFRDFLLKGSKDKLDKLSELIESNIINAVPVDIEGIKIAFTKGKDENDHILLMMVEFTNNYPETRGKWDFSDSKTQIEKTMKYFGSEGEGGASSEM